MDLKSSASFYPMLDRMPGEEIHESLPEQCRECPKLARKVGELASWVSEGRLTAKKAGQLAIEQKGCTPCQPSLTALTC